VSSIRTLVALDTGIAPGTIEGSLPVESTVVNVVGVVEGLDEAWTVLQETAIDLIVVACKGHSDRALYFIEGAIKDDPDRPLVVLSEGSQNGFVRRIFEAGADDIVTLPESVDRIVFALQKAVARKQGAAALAGSALSPFVCVLGPKGGTGKTLVSANLAARLASTGKRVVAVDLDLQFGDLGLALGLAPDRTIYDLASSGGSLDSEKVDAYLAMHSSGARVLLAPTRPDQASAISVQFLRELYGHLRATNDFVIVDTPPGFTPEVIAAIDSSSHICMVGMLDSLSLKNTKLGLETLDLMGYDRSRVQLVLNRADSRVGITREDVDAIIGRSPDVLIPSNRDIPRSVNEGVPIVLSSERSEAARAFRSLAGLYEQEQVLEPAPAPTSNGKGSRMLIGRRG
jgi:pilus assembly protein CpaE